MSRCSSGTTPSIAPTREIVRPTTVRQLPPRTPVTLTVVAFATLLVVAVAATAALWSDSRQRAQQAAADRSLSHV